MQTVLLRICAHLWRRSAALRMGGEKRKEKVSVPGFGGKLCARVVEDRGPGETSVFECPAPGRQGEALYARDFAVCTGDIQGPIYIYIYIHMLYMCIYILRYTKV